MSYTPKHETILSKKLAGILEQVKTTKPQKRGPAFRDPRPSPTSWIQDGVDHLNIWDYGATDLGKILAHGTPLPFTHEVFGRFNTMEAFWNYISSEEHDDRIRTMKGRTLYEFSKKLSKIHVPNFCAIIVEANYQKIQQYPDVVEAIKESELPFDCYYKANRGTGIPMRPPYASWLVAGFEEIRTALKAGRAPDLSVFMDEGDTGRPCDKIYAAMTKNQTQAQAQPKPEEAESEAAVEEVAETQVEDVETNQSFLAAN